MVLYKRNIIVAIIFFVVAQLSAQQRKKKPPVKQPPPVKQAPIQQPPPSVQQPDAIPQQTTTVNDASNSLNTSPPPIQEKDKNTAILSLIDSVPQSLRIDNGVPGSDINVVKKPLPYPRINPNDVAWKQRVWEELDVRQKMNIPFSSDRSVDDQNTITFIDVLFEGIRKGAFKVFEDEKFTKMLTDEEIIKLIQGVSDTVDVPDATDPRGLRKIKKIVFNKLNPSDIKKYRLKEEWLFDKRSSRLVFRILGIAPLRTIKNTETGLELGQQPLFWIYYPDCRNFIASYTVPSFKNYAQKLSWNQIFELHFFTANIIKSTMDNPQGRRIAEYIKDPYQRLIESENIRTKIFNYEQTLWAY